MKRCMKGFLVLSLAGAMFLGTCMTSYATAYVGDLAETVEEQRVYVNETLPEEIETLETVTIPELEEKLKEAQENYDAEQLKEGYKDPVLEIKVGNAEGDLFNAQLELEQKKKQLESEKYHLEQLEKQLSQRISDAYSPSSYYDDGSGFRSTSSFILKELSDGWYVLGEYRGWQALMGGKWIYDENVTDDLDISLYDSSDNCVESSLSRSSSHDTETKYAWKVSDDLESGANYFLELYGEKFRVIAMGSSYGSWPGKYPNGISEDTSDENTSNDDTDYDTDDVNYNNTDDVSNNISTSTDYPAFYDGSLTDEIPNQVYYASSSDNGWVNSIIMLGDGNVGEVYGYSKADGSRVSGWLNYEGKWYGFGSDNFLKNGWLTVGGNWYYGNEWVSSGRDCNAVTGWKEINGKWYYFNSSCQMVSNCIVDGYTIGADGVWIQ